MSAKRIAAGLMVGVMMAPLLLGLGGCEGPTKQQSGAVIGAGLGGLLGAQVGHGGTRTAATIGGAILGGLLGGAIGSSMDETDRLRAAHALEYNRACRGKVFTATVSSAGIGVNGRRIAVDREQWTECRACAHFRDCYDLSMAKLAFERALRRF